jgi:hypothetical protein
VLGRVLMFRWLVMLGRLVMSFGRLAVRGAPRIVGLRWLVRMIVCGRMVRLWFGFYIMISLRRVRRFRLRLVGMILFGRMRRLWLGFVPIGLGLLLWAAIFTPSTVDQVVSGDK